MRILMLFLGLFPLSAWSCVPNIPESAALQYFPEPKFKNIENISETSGHLKALVSITAKGKIVSIHSLEVSPEGLPDKPVLDSLKKARFLMLNNQPIDNQEIVIPFNITSRKKPKVEFSGIVTNGI